MLETYDCEVRVSPEMDCHVFMIFRAINSRALGIINLLHTEYTVSRNLKVVAAVSNGEQHVMRFVFYDIITSSFALRMSN
jgi:hypothetical protein